jgi:hypothetical protein
MYLTIFSLSYQVLWLRGHGFCAFSSPILCSKYELNAVFMSVLCNVCQCVHKVCRKCRKLWLEAVERRFSQYAINGKYV